MLRALLARVRRGDATLDEAVSALKHAPFERMGDVATVDTHRTLRIGMPEVVLAESKTGAQVAAIARKLAARGPLLVTRLAPDKAAPARRAVKGSVYDPVSRTLRRGRMDLPARGPVAVCCAGTSDIPVCEEAAVTLDVMGVEVVRVYGSPSVRSNRSLHVSSGIEQELGRAQRRFIHYTDTSLRSPGGAFRQRSIGLIGFGFLHGSTERLGDTHHAAGRCYILTGLDNPHHLVTVPRCQFACDHDWWNSVVLIQDSP